MRVVVVDDGGDVVAIVIARVRVCVAHVDAGVGNVTVGVDGVYVDRIWCRWWCVRCRVLFMLVLLVMLLLFVS